METLNDALRELLKEIRKIHSVMEDNLKVMGEVKQNVENLVAKNHA